MAIINNFSDENNFMQKQKLCRMCKKENLKKEINAKNNNVKNVKKEEQTDEEAKNNFMHLVYTTFYDEKKQSDDYHFKVKPKKAHRCCRQYKNPCCGTFQVKLKLGFFLF